MGKIILEEQAAPDTPTTDKVAIYPKAGGEVYKKSDDGVEEQLLTGTGQATIPTINLTGGQIAFPDTAIPSADANTLDDYDEGTFVPTITCSTSGSYTTTSYLAYTKIGRQVTITGVLATTGETSPDGDIRISIPFACLTLAADSAHSFGSAFLYLHGGTIPNGVSAHVGEGLAYFTLRNVSDAGTVQTLDMNDVDSVWYLGVNFSYFAQ